MIETPSIASTNVAVVRRRLLSSSAAIVLLVILCRSDPSQAFGINNDGHRRLTTTTSTTTTTTPSMVATDPMTIAEDTTAIAGTTTTVAPSYGYVDRSAVNAILDDDDEDEDDSEDDGDDDRIADFFTISDAARSRVSGALRRKKRPSSEGGNKVRARVKETGEESVSQYMKTMASHELLREEDEKVLGRQVRILVKWEEQKNELEEKLLRTPTFAEWATFVNTTVPELKKQIRRSQRAKAALVEANLRLVVSTARKVVKGSEKNVAFHDACQEGIIGLTKACEKYDPEKGFRFSTYANWWVKRGIMESVEEQTRIVKVPYNTVMKINKMKVAEITMTHANGRRPTDTQLAERLDISFEELRFLREKGETALKTDAKVNPRQRKGSGAGSGGDGDDNASTFGDFAQDPDQRPLDRASERTMRNDVRRLVTTLGPKEQAVIRLRFGLDGDDPSTKSLAYISRRFNVPVEKIRKVEANALRKLQQPYRSDTVKCYVSDYL